MYSPIVAQHHESFCQSFFGCKINGFFLESSIFALKKATYADIEE